MSHQHAQPDLNGRRILVGRARPGPSTIASRLRALGAIVVEAPNVQVEPLSDLTDLDQALQNIHLYQTIIFACATSVEVVVPRLKQLDWEHRPPIIAIGKQATDALHRFNIDPHIATSGACRQELRAHLTHLAGTTSLCFVSAGGRQQLATDLLALQIGVRTIDTYRYSYHMPKLAQNTLDLVIIPSSSTASSLFASDWAPMLKTTPIVAIGEASANQARLCGAQSIIQAEHDTIDALVTCAIQQLTFIPAGISERT